MANITEWAKNVLEEDDEVLVKPLIFPETRSTSKRLTAVPKTFLESFLYYRAHGKELIKWLNFFSLLHNCTMFPITNNLLFEDYFFICQPYIQ